MAHLQVPSHGLRRASEARRASVDEVWSADGVRDAAVLGLYWLAHPKVAARVNILASGQPDVDPYAHLVRLLAARGWTLPISRVISLGCGFGSLERDLAARGLVDGVLGLDLAAGAITEARRLASTASLDGLEYRVTDLEGAKLPRASAELILAHQAVHHIEDLEGLFQAVRLALRPGGVLHLHEFVGPKRFQWTDAQLALGNAFLDSLPPRLRRLTSGAPKGRLHRPTIETMLRTDPTEAIRSSDIRAALSEEFRIIEERQLGGTLVHIVLGDIAQNFLPDDAEANLALDRLFLMEDEAMAAGRIGSDFVTYTAVPRRYGALLSIRRALRLLRGRARPHPHVGVAEPAQSFDEAWYLTTFPDVSAAVEQGVFASAEDHWTQFGRAEGRPPSG